MQKKGRTGDDIRSCLQNHHCGGPRNGEVPYHYTFYPKRVSGTLTPNSSDGIHPKNYVETPNLFADLGSSRKRHFQVSWNLFFKNHIKSWFYSRYYNERRGPSPRLSPWAKQLQRNVAAVASSWRHHVCFDRLGHRTPDFPGRERCLEPLRRLCFVCAGIKCLVLIKQFYFS